MKRSRPRQRSRCLARGRPTPSVSRTKAPSTTATWVYGIVDFLAQPLLGVLLTFASSNPQVGNLFVASGIAIQNMTVEEILSQDLFRKGPYQFIYRNTLDPLYTR